MAKTSNLGHHFAKDLEIFVPGDKDFFEDEDGNDNYPGKKCSSALATTDPMYKVFGKSTSSKAGQSRYDGCSE